MRSPGRGWRIPTRYSASWKGFRRKRVERRTRLRRERSSLDEALAEAHASQGTVRALYDWDWVGAERSFRRAIELDPNSALAHYGLSKVLASEGRFDAAIVEAKRSLDLDPLAMIVASSLGVGAFRRRAGIQKRTLLLAPPSISTPPSPWTTLFSEPGAARCAKTTTRLQARKRRVQSVGWLSTSGWQRATLEQLREDQLIVSLPRPTSTPARSASRFSADSDRDQRAGEVSLTTKLTSPRLIRTLRLSGISRRIEAEHQ